MKVLSSLAISTACSISLSFLLIAQPARAVSESETNNSFATRKFIPSATSTVDGQLSNEKVDYYTFSGLDRGNLFTAEVNSQSFDPLLGWLDDSGKILAINDDQSDNNVLPLLTGTIPVSGNLNLALSGTRDINLAGDHFQSGSYTLSLKDFPLTKPSTNSRLINGGFETGDFTGWKTLGSTNIETAAFGSGPTNGTYQSLLSTGGAKFDGSIIEKFLGLNAGSLNNLAREITPDSSAFSPIQQTATQGSAIEQTFTAKAGDILTFDWDFLTDEVLPPVPFSDFSFVSINSQSDGSISYLSELADITTVTSAISATRFFKETGFHTFSFNIPTTGTYTLGLGVTNVGDTTLDSGLLVDNVKLTSVPEPTSVFSVLVFGALGTGSVLKRKQ